MILVYLKNIREPLALRDNLGKIVKEIYENEETPNDQKIRLPLWSGVKGDIRSIIVEKERVYIPTPPEPQVSDAEKARISDKYKEIGDFIKRL